LRVRQRPHGVWRLSCPDCQRPIELIDQGGELLVRPGEEAGARAMDHRQALSVTVPATNWPRRLGGKLGRYATDPLIVTWLAAGTAAAVLAAAFLKTHREPAEREPAEMPVANGGALSVPIDELSPAEEAVSARESSAEHEASASPRATQPAVAAAQSGVRQPVERPRRPVAAPRPPVRVPDSPAVDPRETVAAQLAQRVVRFEQPVPVSFETVRAQMEEIAGISIRYAQVIHAIPYGEKEIMFSLRETTVADVLEEVANQVGLEPQIENDGILLVPVADPRQVQQVVRERP
jgi:hypothetical protein